MAKITVHAGDFLKGDGTLSFKTLYLRTPEHQILGERIPLDHLAEVEIATEQTVKKLGGTLGWGLAGGALLGPVGLLAGLLAGGRKKEVTFVAKLKDGRKFLATSDNGTFVKLEAGTF